MSPISPATRTELRHQFGSTIYTRGVRLWEEGAVLSMDMNAHDELVAVVSGSKDLPYVVVVHSPTDGDFASYCTCPYADDCKHGAAASLAWLEHKNARVPDESPQGKAPADTDPAYAWIERLKLARQSTSATPRDTRYVTQWIYELWGVGLLPATQIHTVHGSSARLQANGANLCIRKSKPLKNGTWGKGTVYRIVHEFNRHQHPTEVDEDLHALLASQVHRSFGYRGVGKDGLCPLHGANGRGVLERVISTGRCFLASERDTPLHWGPPVALELDWVNHDDTFRPRIDVAIDGDWALIATEPPSYLAGDSHCVGHLETELSGAELALLLEAPPLCAEAARVLSESMASSDPVRSRERYDRGDRHDRGDHTPASGTRFPVPIDTFQRRIDVDPTPVLLVHSPDHKEHVSSWRVVPMLMYEDVAFANSPYDSPHVSTHRDDAGNEVVINRRPALEDSLYEEFRARCHTFVPSAGAFHEANGSADHEPRTEDASTRFLEFRRLVTQRDNLEQHGWKLTVLPPVHTEVTRVFDVEASIEPDDDTPGWFELGGYLLHEGHRYALLPLVVTWLEGESADAPLYMHSADGEWLEVPATLLAPFAAVLAELGEMYDGQPRIRLSRARALSLDALNAADDLHIVWQDEHDLLELGRRLRALGEATHLPVQAPPEGIIATLRPYQLAGLGWMNMLAEHGLNGLLADDMGLGKTLQTIAHVVSQRESGELNKPTLVIAPTSLLGNWHREITRFAPSLTVRVWHGIERHLLPLDEDASDILITSYTLALRDRELLAARPFGLLVLDEAQAIKNPQAKSARAVKSLPIGRRLCLTGTPLENHLGELWSQFDFLMPGLLGDQSRFTHHFRTPIEKRGDTERQARLAAAVRPFVLRRRKEDVATELPPKTEIVRSVRLEGAQATLYESLRVAMQERVQGLLKERGLARSHIDVLDALLKLRQTCCHPQLVKLPSAKRVKASAKTELALDMIDELIDEGRRILLFSQFTGMLSLLEEGLAERGHRWVKLTGRTRKRDAVVDAFQNGEVPLFLISLKAGGTGLNLTAADTVIHYDPWWNPAAERQASDRAHRIGQTKPVFVYRLVTEDTVEERIVAMQAKKQALADAMIEHGTAEGVGRMSTDEVLSLFDA